MKHFLDGDLIAWDCETTGLNPWTGDEPFAFSFCNGVGETAYYEFDVDPFTRKVIYRPKAVAKMSRLLGDPRVAKVGHNLKFDVRMAERGPKIIVRGAIHETMFAAHVCNSNERNFKLKPLADKYANIPTDDKKALGKCVKSCRARAKKLGWKIHKDPKADYWLPRAFWKRLNDPDEATRDAARDLLERYPNLDTICREYAVLDAIRTMVLHRMYQDVLIDEGLGQVYDREIRLWPVVYDMETRGVRISLKATRKEQRRCQRIIQKHRITIVKKFGEFKKKIPADRLRAHLFGDVSDGGLGIVPKKGELTEKKKQPQVGKVVLLRHADKSPVLKAVVEYDKHLKANSTYFNNYIKMHVDRIIHCNFNQIGPTTGRFSSRMPNLQNVPKRAVIGDIMRRVRRPFRPRKGYVWLHFDYKAIEARIFAECAGETDMLRIFREGGDVYRELVKRVAKALNMSVESLNELFKDFEDGSGEPARQVCKNNFLGWTYGEGAKKMAQALRLPQKIAERIIIALQEAYPRAMPFMEEMQGIAKREKEIHNRYGRKVPIPRPAWTKDPETGEKFLARFEYTAVNYLVQSTAADLLKEAMIRLAAYLQKSGRDAHLIMTIHDELVVECARAQATPKFVKRIAKLMSDNQGMFTEVATPCDVKVTTRSWDEPAKIETLWEQKVAA